MISVETARRLKEAGLQYYKPKAGDWYYDERAGVGGDRFLVTTNYRPGHWLTWREGAI